MWCFLSCLPSFQDNTGELLAHCFFLMFLVCVFSIHPYCADPIAKPLHDKTPCRGYGIAIRIIQVIHLISVELDFHGPTMKRARQMWIMPMGGCTIVMSMSELIIIILCPIFNHIEHCQSGKAPSRKVSFNSWHSYRVTRFKLPLGYERFSRLLFSTDSPMEMIF